MEKLDTNSDYALYCENVYDDLWRYLNKNFYDIGREVLEETNSIIDEIDTQIYLPVRTGIWMDNETE